MKRVNIYITEDTDKKIDTLSELFQVNRSEIMRKALAEFSEKHEDELNDFVSDLDEMENEIPDDTSKLEFLRECNNSPEFFIENCLKINSVDHGFVPFQLYKYQKQLLFKVDTYKRIIMNTSRQIGLSSLMAGHILHYSIFNSDKTVAIIMPKQSMAVNALTQIKIMIDNLPKFIKEGVIKNVTKRYIDLSNGSRILTGGMTVDCVRGQSINYLYVDGFSHAPRTVADEFIASIFPTIASGNNTKLVISSTPNGMNHFFKMWADAISNYNSFHAIKLPYHLIDGRDEDWVLQQKASIGDDAFQREFNCSFIDDKKGDLYVV